MIPVQVRKFYAPISFLNNQTANFVFETLTTYLSLPIILVERYSRR